jgi:isopentenyl-diphosphate delta-isomerase
MEFVILVDEQDNAIGSMEKQQAHVEGVLHRAFSVFIFNSKKELLLQKRASTKYHCGGMWTNTCCSHPRENESVLEAANRRLQEEMGMQTFLSTLFHFTYFAELDNQLIEHELDHVLIGHSDDEPKLNPLEVSEYRWESLDAIKKEMEANPKQFTVWFKKIILEYQQQFKQTTFA